ncbi:hypothetical protein CS542_07065 [Pedobacter sp. IW39]|nr:hypothetical protein CS542_07065 [Pedobacter sp. IW39]
MMEEIIANSELNWEIVRPGMLNVAFKQKYKVLPGLYKGIKIGRYQGQMLLLFIRAENPTMLKQYPALTSSNSIRS